jgi:hypothetical protein
MCLFVGWHISDSEITNAFLLNLKEVTKPQTKYLTPVLLLILVLQGEYYLIQLNLKQKHILNNFNPVYIFMSYFIGYLQMHLYYNFGISMTVSSGKIRYSWG